MSRRSTSGWPRDADRQEIVEFLSIEGGPDGGFDDLVAACQIGLDGTAKLELAQNYWDEMGNGSLARVHTELHRKLSRALGLSCPPRERQPVEALERSVLTGLLATNRWLQPEMLGALGLLELQAGPRCRKVVAALERIGAGEDALDFYVEHAHVDPRHGKDWVDKAVTPFDDDPRWAAGIVRGARWRSDRERRLLRRHGRHVRRAAAAGLVTTYATEEVVDFGPIQVAFDSSVLRPRAVDPRPVRVGGGAGGRRRDAARGRLWRRPHRPRRRRDERFPPGPGRP